MPWPGSSPCSLFGAFAGCCSSSCLVQAPTGPIRDPSSHLNQKGSDPPKGSNSSRGLRRRRAVTGSSPLATQISFLHFAQAIRGVRKFRMCPGDFTTSTHVRNGLAAPVRRLGFRDSAEKVSKKKLRTPSRRDQLQEHGALLGSSTSLSGSRWFATSPQDSMSPGQAFLSPGPEPYQVWSRRRSLLLVRETRQTRDETTCRPQHGSSAPSSLGLSLPLLRLIPVGRYFAEMSQARTPSGAWMRGGKGGQRP